MRFFEVIVCRVLALIGVTLIVSATLVSPAGASTGIHVAQAKAKTIEIPFKTHDGYAMFGKLTIPDSAGRHPVLIYCQTAEGMSVGS